MYILGDLFDYWMEFPTEKFIPNLGTKVLDEFEKLNKAVKPALYITGNHDNWTFGHFEDRGFDLEENYRITQIHDKRTLLMHGDGVQSKEFNFPRALSHRLLRNPTFVRYYQKILRPEKGLSMMKWFSSQTRKRDLKDPEPLNKQAKELLEATNVDYLLCGHDHIPRQETFSAGTYINTGAFFKHQSVAVYNNDQISLVTWQANTKKFVPFP